MFFTIDEVIDERGHTGLYMQYAYARTQSIFKRGGYLSEGAVEVDVAAWANADVGLLVHPRERDLIFLISRLPSIVSQVLDGLAVHSLADYGHDLAEHFASFYEECPILRSDVPGDLKLARLALVEVSAQTLRNVSSLLGLPLPDRL